MNFFRVSCFVCLFASVVVSFFIYVHLLFFFFLLLFRLWAGNELMRLAWRFPFSGFPFVGGDSREQHEDGTLCLFVSPCLVVSYPFFPSVLSLFSTLLLELCTIGRLRAFGRVFGFWTNLISHRYAKQYYNIHY